MRNTRSGYCQCECTALTRSPTTANESKHVVGTKQTSKPQWTKKSFAICRQWEVLRDRSRVDQDRGRWWRWSLDRGREKGREARRRRFVLWNDRLLNLVLHLDHPYSRCARLSPAHRVTPSIRVQLCPFTHHRLLQNSSLACFHLFGAFEGTDQVSKVLLQLGDASRLCNAVVEFKLPYQLCPPKLDVQVARLREQTWGGDTNGEISGWPSWNLWHPEDPQ